MVVEQVWHIRIGLLLTHLSISNRGTSLLGPCAARLYDYRCAKLLTPLSSENILFPSIFVKIEMKKIMPSLCHAFSDNGRTHASRRHLHGLTRTPPSSLLAFEGRHRRCQWPLTLTEGGRKDAAPKPQHVVKIASNLQDELPAGIRTCTLSIASACSPLASTPHHRSEITA